MGLIFITGNSGSGKSSVKDELVRRGYEAHDTDENGLSSWQNKTTGKVVWRPDDEAERTHEWYASHAWNMSRQRVEELAAAAKDKPIFLCGSATNADDMLDAYDTIFYLSIDEETLKTRLSQRTNNDFGKAPDELASILGWHAEHAERYEKYGAVMLDATKPVEVLVDSILDSLKD